MMVSSAAVLLALTAAGAPAASVAAASIPAASMPATSTPARAPASIPASIPAAGPAVMGAVTDAAGQPVVHAMARLRNPEGKTVARAFTDDGGAFVLRGVAPGRYTLEVDASGFLTGTEPVSVEPGTQVASVPPVVLETPGGVVTVHVKVQKVPPPARTGVVSHVVTRQQIAERPGASTGRLSDVLDTQAGVTPGAFGQTFFRGMHGNVQYRINDVQLPPLSGLSFGSVVDPRNIERLDVVTGGYPAEYGLQLGAIVNVATRTGPLEPGGTAELRFGTYQTLNPSAQYGGSLGWLHYYAGASYLQNERGIDPPQFSPIFHDHQRATSEVLTLDGAPTQRDRFTLVAAFDYDHQEIPNFTNGGTVPFDRYGNMTLPNVPPDTDDRQIQTDGMVVAGWHHTFTPELFLNVSPYVRLFQLDFLGDPVNDLSGGPGTASTTDHKTAANQGVHASVEDRLGAHRIKTGADGNFLLSYGTLSILRFGQPAPYAENDRINGYTESAWAQDEWHLTSRVTATYGLRFDAHQDYVRESALSPRVALSYALTPDTTVHGFYGRLFMPPPVENIVASATAAGIQTTSGTFNTRAEDDQDFEAGLASRFFRGQLLYSIDAYYRPGEHVLDDTQLGNTAIFVPYNYRTGLAYGLDQSLQGTLSEHWNGFASLTLEHATGTGIETGLFLFPVGTNPNLRQRLDHDQLADASAGLAYHDDTTLLSFDGLYGSGLPTGPTNNETLPQHVTFNMALARKFSARSWLGRGTVEIDALNLLNAHFAYNIANGFNGNHFAPGREVFVRLIKDL